MRLNRAGRGALRVPEHELETWLDIAEVESRATRIVAKLTHQVLRKHKTECNVCGRPGAQALASTPRGDRPIHDSCRGVQAPSGQLNGGRGAALEPLVGTGQGSGGARQVQRVADLPTLAPPFAGG